LASLVVALCIIAAPAHAGTANATFPVNITLNNPGVAGVAAPPATSSGAGYCTTQTSFQETNATVTVTCADNVFVDIEPGSGPFVDTHDTARRFLLTPALLAPALQAQSGEPAWHASAGTITILHVSRKRNGLADAMEIQVHY
jgi:hypothetical protein